MKKKYFTAEARRQARNENKRRWSRTHPGVAAAQLREWKKNNPGAYQNIIDAARETRQKITRVLGHLKLFETCQRCGYAEHPSALDFHHREGETKVHCVGRMVAWNWIRLMDEIMKCDVLCSNCHRVITTTSQKVPDREHLSPLRVSRLPLRDDNTQLIPNGNV